MPPKRNNNSGKKKQAAPQKKKDSRPATPAAEVPAQDGAASPAPAAAAAEEAAKAEITVAFSLGSEYATFTLLPAEAGQRGEIIANEDGERQIPAIVAIAGSEEIAGTAAKAQMIRNMVGTVRRFVPLVGLKFADPKVDAAAKATPVPVEENADGFPEFVLTHYVLPDNAKDEDEPEELTTRYTPENLTTVLLRTLKQSAESYTGARVARCVLSYPTDFSSEQQQSLVRAAQAAGMEVASLIPEPVAATLAYEHIKRTVGHTGCNGVTVVADVGASSTTISLMNQFAGLITPIAHTTLPIGGVTLDQALAGHFAADFKKRTQHDTTTNRKATEKLLVACEIARKVLSQATIANCHVESFYEGIDYVSSVNRTRFETLAAKWKRQLDAGITDFLEAQNVDADEVDHVLLVGGVAFTPFVQRMFENKFGRAAIETQIDGDEAVAFGTAIHGLQPAAHHTAHGAEHADRETAAPHLTHAIGVLDTKGHFVTVIPRDTPIPVKHAVIVPVADAANVLVQVAEGRELEPLPESDDEAEESDEENEDDDEEEDAIPLYKGTLLGELAVEATAGQALDKVELVFTVSAEGKLHVSATGIEKKTAHKVHITLDL
ncbi:Hsp70 protein that interacts with Zuo1p [Blastocladiella emersonii ATCC 22665]|uniref:Heat shock protein Hsp70-6 n=1 Tax=Blastocladiella emersonii TaxID=4808 RepID=A1XM67_BLAEM|nr:heat shock protein Hsp70-6 [Blastocladiella emersonii]KAI9188446.1 Hsp70 protein that interacts with Zuo1p [Blastocladiella emersonii ATCC 22665]